MKKSTLVGGVSALVGIALGSVSTIAFNKIKSSKEEKIESNESIVKDSEESKEV